ncbi:MAG TPA: NAD-dependent epimerase/dehydratase family protein [Terriglobales bacterium]|nr:NAD-dependent epimerase/dehydratase family protein [Terriglobales bacterium]
MATARPTVLVTGVSGDLGLRLLPQLAATYDVIGVDLHPPETSTAVRFTSMNLEREECCHELMLLMREHRVQAVAHLAFVMDSVRTGIVDSARMWQINVAGTARVMETIAEVNRDEVLVKKFIFPSSVLVYGPGLSMATEDGQLNGDTLACAAQQVEAEKVVRHRAPGLRGCSAYVLRSHIFVGASVRNGLMAAFRGAPGGKSARADKLRSRGKKLSFALPRGRKYLQNRVQFTHVDDMARLIVHIAGKTEPEPQKITLLNVAGWGEPLTYASCLQAAQLQPLRLPGKWATRMFWRRLWERGVSAVPYEMVDYLTEDWVMNIERLKKYLGQDFEKVIRYSAADAFAESLDTAAHAAAGS